MSEDRRAAFKKWLGLRYDRPAVPERLVPLAKRIGEEVARRERRPTGLRVRDVLMQFDETVTPPRFSLYGILDEPADEADVRAWLADIARAVPRELGIGDVFEAKAAAGISLQLIETSFSADVTQLTWGAEAPRGAR
jgi:hypothetical protein